METINAYKFLCGLCEKQAFKTRSQLIKHLEDAHHMVRARTGDTVENNKGEYYEPQGCACWQPGDTRCRCCTGSLKMFWQPLSPALVDCLKLIADKVQETGVNAVQKRDLDMTHSQYGNFQKLRYFALIHHVKDDEGNNIPATWLVTRQGWAFLRGQWQPHARVQTFQNRIQRRSPETVTIHDVMRKRDKTEYWPHAAQYQWDLATPQLGLPL